MSSKRAFDTLHASPLYSLRFCLFIFPDFIVFCFHVLNSFALLPAVPPAGYPLFYFLSFYLYICIMKTYSEVLQHLQNNSFKKTCNIHLNRAYVYDAFHSAYLYDFQETGYIQYLLLTLPYTYLIESIDYSDNFNSGSYQINLLTASALSVQQILDNYYFKNILPEPSIWKGCFTYYKPGTSIFYNSVSNGTTWSPMVSSFTAFGISAGDYIAYKNGVRYWHCGGTDSSGSNTGAIVYHPNSYMPATPNFTLAVGFNGNGEVIYHGNAPSSPYNPRNLIFNRGTQAFRSILLDLYGTYNELDYAQRTSPTIVFQQFQNSNKEHKLFVDGKILSKIVSSFVAPSSWGGSGVNWFGSDAYNYALTDGIYFLITYSTVLPIYILNLIGQFMSNLLAVDFIQFNYNFYNP